MPFNWCGGVLPEYLAPIPVHGPTSFAGEIIVDWKMSVMLKGEIRQKRKESFILTRSPYTTQEWPWDIRVVKVQGWSIRPIAWIWPHVTSFFGYMKE
jgi:hypothetical protein